MEFNTFVEPWLPNRPTHIQIFVSHIFSKKFFFALHSKMIQTQLHFQYFYFYQLNRVHHASLTIPPTIPHLVTKSIRFEIIAHIFFLQYIINTEITFIFPLHLAAAFFINDCIYLSFYFNSNSLFASL